MSGITKNFQMKLENTRKTKREKLNRLIVVCVLEVLFFVLESVEIVCVVVEGPL